MCHPHKTLDTTTHNSTSETLFMLAFRIDTVISLKITIPSLWILSYGKEQN